MTDGERESERKREKAKKNGELTLVACGCSTAAGVDGVDGNRDRRATAVVGEVEDEGDGSGDPGSIPPVGRERRMRRCFLSASIYSWWTKT